MDSRLLLKVKVTDRIFLILEGSSQSRTRVHIYTPKFEILWPKKDSLLIKVLQLSSVISNMPLCLFI